VKILIAGSSGQLGFELVRQAEARGMGVRGLRRQEMDITDSSAVNSRVNAIQPDLVINAAAYTAVDRAESETAKAYAVNRDGVVNLAEACKAIDAPLIHVSTDYVFDGSKAGPYNEKDAVGPASVYGASKLAGERALRMILNRHIILRTAWVYGVHGYNFVKTMLKLGRDRAEIRVVADQFGCPTAAADIAGAILDIANRIDAGNGDSWGIYHYCADGMTSWHGFATAIFTEAREYEAFRVDRILPITTAEYPTPAQRPLNSALDCTKIRGSFGISPRPWQQSLRQVIRELLCMMKS